MSHEVGNIDIAHSVVTITHISTIIDMVWSPKKR